MDSSQNSNDGYGRDDWQKHYAEDDLRWDLGQVAPPFVRLWEEGKLGQGRVIIPGCGRGHEVLFLAGNGFQVTGLDYAPGAVELLSRSLQEKGVQADILHQDFFELGDNHISRYDLMLEQAFFCAIHPSRRSAYVETAARIIKKGGLLAGLFYETNEKGGPPFNTTPADILEHFSDEFDIETLERTPHSVEKRKDKELLGLLRKK
ncbi:MAG: methyltransferase domain-containing protein [Nitrospinae bacterium]|jgi:methyl halide transferase|nr:methyltransferase domain-containing protein [Nitrospinota bacterium]MDA1109040.1 methyltransferase domain-containing protein [Nitrospinota bacterium]